MLFAAAYDERCYTRGVEILGHRGASAEFAENTSLQCEARLRKEPDGVELDVQRCGVANWWRATTSSLKRLFS